MMNFGRMMSFLLVMAMLVAMVPPATAFASETETTEVVAETTVESSCPEEETTAPVPELTEAQETEPTSAETEPEEETAAATEETAMPEEPGEAVTEPSEIPTVPEEIPEATTEPSEGETLPDETAAEGTEVIDVPEETLEAALGEADALWKGTCGKKLRWYMDGVAPYNYVLHIYGTGPMYNYDWENLPPWNAYGIEKIIIESGITSIGNLAFWGIPAKSVSLPETVTSIGKWAFLQADIESITIPSKVAEIKDNAFSSCWYLKSITLPAGLKTIGNYAFENCDSLRTVVIPSGVTKIGSGAFQNCAALQTASIPASVTTIVHSPFGDCPALKKITVDKNNKNFIDMDGILYDKKLTKLINCPGGRTEDVIVPEGVKTITSESMAGCSNVKNIVFPKSVTRFEMFALREVHLDTMVFKGNAPTFLETSFPLCSGKVYYPHNNSTWTKDKWSHLVETNFSSWEPCAVYEDGSISAIYPYFGSPYTVNEEFAVRMAEYSLLAYHNTGNDGKKGFNADALGKKLDADGYENLYSYYYSDYPKTVTNHHRGEASETSTLFTIGHRKVRDSKDAVVDEIIVVFRGTYKNEWLGNFDVTGPWYDKNSGPIHENFEWAVEDYAKKHLADYINEFADEGRISRDNLTIVLTGHSRGAAVANILAHKLNQDREKTIASGDMKGMKVRDIYAYTFATPNVFHSSPIISGSFNYIEEANIHNFCFTDDFVPNLPLECWGWGKYGKTYWYSAHKMNSTTRGAVKKWLGEEPVYNSKYTKNIVEALMEAYYDSTYVGAMNHYYNQEYTLAWPLIKATIHEYVRNGLGAQQAGIEGGVQYLASPITGINSGPFRALAVNLAIGGEFNPALKHTHEAISYYCAIKYQFGNFKHSYLTSDGYGATDYTVKTLNLDTASCDPAQVAAINDFLMQKITHEETGAELYNYEILGWNVGDVNDWLGVTWEQGSVVKLDMEYKGAVGHLDLSKFPDLRVANVSSCNLSSIGLSGCDDLTGLYCSNNWLTELDLTDCTSLKILECANNAVEALDLSGCAALEQLECSNNCLRQLDLTGQEHLTRLDCSRNYLDPEDALLQETAQAVRNAGGEARIGEQQVSPDAVFAQNDLNRLAAIAEYENNNAILNWDLENPISWNHVTWVKSGTSHYLETVDFSGLGLKGEAVFDGCLQLTTLNLSENGFTHLSVEGCEALEILWCDWNYLDTDSLILPQVENLKVEPQLVGHSLNEADVAALDALSSGKKLYWDSRLYGANDALTWTEGEDGVYSLTGMDLSGCRITGALDLRAFEKLEWICVSGIRARSLILPQSVREIPEGAFRGCVGLEVVTFTGEVPAISDTAFEELSLCCRYPYGVPGWTEDVLADYGGAILWEYDPDTVPPLTTSFALYNEAGEDVTDTVVWFDANAEESVTFTAVRKPADAMPFTEWKFDSALAEVVHQDDGTITLIPNTESETIELTAATADASGLTAKVTIRVAALQVEKEAEDADIRLLSQKTKTLQLRDGVTGKILTDKQVTWSMDEADTPYAKIDSKGKLTAKKVLEKVRVEAIASIVGSRSTKVTAVVEILPAVTMVELLDGEKTVNNQTLNVDYGGAPLVLTANIHPLDAMEGVSWSIGDKKEAFASYVIDEAAGTLTITPKTNTKAGNVTIKTTSTDGSKKTATVKLQFGTYAKTVTIDKSVTELTAGDKGIQLNAAMIPAVVTKSGIVWSLKNPADKNYVNLSSGGKISPKAVLAPVDVTVVATSKDGMAKDEHTIRILPKSEAQLVIKSGEKYVTKTTQTLDVNTQASITLSAFTYGETEMTAVEWSPLTAKDAEIMVNKDGSLTIKMLSPGSINVTAKAADGRKATVSVKGVKLAQGVEISQKKTGIKEGLEVASGKSIDLQVSLTNAAGKKVAWSIEEGEAYAAIASSGKFTAAKDLTASHKVVVRATAADGSGAYDDMEILVRPIAQGVQVYSEEGGRMTFSFRTQNWWVRSNTTLTWDLSSQEDTIAMDARVYPYYSEDDSKNAAQAVSWKSSAPKVADFQTDADGNVQLKIHRTGSTTITVMAEDGSKQKVTFKLNVVRTVTELTIGDQKVPSGKSLNLAKFLTINPTDATNKKLTWTITKGGEYATISNTGAFKAKKVTSVQTVEVTVSSQDGGASTTFYVTITP